MKTKTILLLTFLLGSLMLNAQRTKNYELKSPDGTIILKVEPGTKLQWSVQHKGQQIILPSSISLLLETGEILGDNADVISAKEESINDQFDAINTEEVWFTIYATSLP